MRALGQHILKQALTWRPMLRRRIRAAFEAADSLDPSARHAVTQRLLSRSLAWAAETPYGTTHRAGRNLSEWPVLTKVELRANPLACCRRGLAGWVYTSGTTGQPLRLKRSIMSAVAESEMIALVLRSAGVHSRTPRTMVLRPQPVLSARRSRPPFGKRLPGRLWSLSPLHLSSSNLLWHLHMIGQFEPEVLVVHTGLLRVLVDRLETLGLTPPRIPVLLTSSEVLDSDLRARAAAMFRGHIVDLYGQSERAAAAFSLRDGEYRFVPGYAHVELEPLAIAGELRYARVIGTPFWNPAMPLVRLDVGDVIELTVADPSPEHLAEVAGARLPFRSVLGRESEYLLTVDGERVVGLSLVPRGVDGIRRVQFLQEETGVVTILVEAPGTIDVRTADRLEANLRSLSSGRLDIRVRQTEDLLVTPLGKTPLVVRHGLR